MIMHVVWFAMSYSIVNAIKQNLSKAVMSINCHVGSELNNTIVIISYGH